jgi:cephalosporin hydroxylase
VKQLSDIENFQQECIDNIASQALDIELTTLSRAWISSSARHKYAYNWRWCGMPIIQFPTDMIAIQEIIWDVRPDIIIETGIARGGSLVFYATLLALLDLAERSGSKSLVTSHRRVIGVDIDVRLHNRQALEAHPFFYMMRLVEGSSVSDDVVMTVRSQISEDDKVLVILDSNHTHEHVLKELHAYAPLVTRGSFCVVHDTGIEYSPADSFPGKIWGPGNSPLSAVREYLKLNSDFEQCPITNNKLLITSSPGGYLRRV